MRKSLLVGAAVLTLVIASQANADILFYTSPGAVQPDENLLLQDTGLATTGNPVYGLTNQTQTIFEITGDENLVLPSSGQARVESSDGLFSSAIFDALDPLLFFTEFEANINVTDAPLISVGVREIDGTVNVFAYTGGPGQNYFGVEAINGQLIDFITVSTGSDVIEDIRQIRVGGIQNREGEPPPVVPEPATLLLLGSGLVAAAARRRAR